MKRCALRFVIAWGLAALATAACGESGQATESEPTPDPGTGTGVLKVVFSLTAEPYLADARRPTDFDTYTSATLERYGARVAEADVILDTDAGEKHLLPSDEPGIFEGSHAGYHRVYRLRVVAGADRLDDVVIVGPRVHAITTPTGDTPLTSGAALSVRWQADDVTESARVRLASYEADGLPDNGSHDIPAGNELPLDGSTVQVEVLRLTRMGLTGGAVGSEAVARLRNRTLPLTVCPAEGCP